MVKRRQLTKDRVEFTNEGQSFTGHFVNHEIVPYIDKDTQESKNLNKYTFNNAVGDFILMGGAKVDEGMENAHIGDLIEVTYLGTAPTSKGNTIKLFRIEALEEEEGD